MCVFLLGFLNIKILLGVYLTNKEFAPIRSKFFRLRADSFSDVKTGGRTVLIELPLLKVFKLLWK